MRDLSAVVSEAQSGDLEAFAQLVHRFQHMAFGYAYAILHDAQDAEDVSQDAFVEAYRSLADLREPAAFPGWLRRIVHKYCDRTTRRRRSPTVPLDTIAEPSSPAPEPESVLEHREAQRIVSAALAALSERQRQATVLFHIDGYSQREIATFLEVPITTVKKRLYDARQSLKERIVEMAKEMPKLFSLPANLAQRVARYPFPVTEPPVEVVDLSGRDLRIRCLDAQAYFVPLADGASCDWTFYDWPGGRLTGVYESRIVGSAEWRGGALLREWERFTDLDAEEKHEWSERHILIADDTWRWVRIGEIERDGRPVYDHSQPGHPEDPSYVPVPMDLRVGRKWAGFAGGEAVGVSRVRIGERSWRCLKVTAVAQHHRTGDRSPAVYAEWYIAEHGRTVLFRRYNGPGYREPKEATSFESLAGSMEVEHQGIVFRRAYDCIPDIALDGV